MNFWIFEFLNSWNCEFVKFWKTWIFSNFWILGQHISFFKRSELKHTFYKSFVLLALRCNTTFHSTNANKFLRQSAERRRWTRQAAEWRAAVNTSPKVVIIIISADKYSNWPFSGGQDVPGGDWTTPWSAAETNEEDSGSACQWAVATVWQTRHLLGCPTRTNQHAETRATVASANEKSRPQSPAAAAEDEPIKRLLLELVRSVGKI